MNRGYKGRGEGTGGKVRKNERGQVLVELALCATIYVIIILGILDVSRVLLRLHQLSQVAREGARIASVTVDPGGAGYAYVMNCMGQILTHMNLTGANAPNITITPITLTGVATTEVVDIQVSQTVGSILGRASLIPGLSGQTISATISMPQFVT